MSPRSLGHLLDRAKHKEEALSKELARLAADVKQSEERLAELRRYSQEYDAANSLHLNPVLLTNRLAFREKLDAALSAQNQQVMQRQKRCDNSREQLVEASRDTKVLENLSEKYAIAAQKEALRIEQKQLDEFAGRSRPRQMMEGDRP